jgi:hypothetical protein
MGESERIFTLAQRKAAEVVAEVAAVPPIPDAIWHAPNPAEELPRIQEHRATWGALQVAVVDFERAHAVARLVRDILGYGSDNLPDGAPRFALTYRNWRPVLDALQLPRLKAPLKLPYALSKGYEPGCWKPADIATKPQTARSSVDCTTPAAPSASSGRQADGHPQRAEVAERGQPASSP